MNMTAQRLRYVMLAIGAITAIGTAAADYFAHDQTPTLQGLLLAAGIGLFAFATKAPGTVTRDEAADTAAKQAQDAIARLLGGVKVPVPVSPWAERAQGGLVEEDVERMPTDPLPPPGKLPSGLLALLFAFVALSPMYGCASTADVQIRTALDVTGEMIDPAYSAAMTACAMRERAEVDLAVAGAISPDAAGAAIAPIRARCNQLATTFEAIRALHDSAADAVDRGDVAGAQARIDELRAMWAKMKAGA